MKFELLLDADVLSDLAFEVLDELFVDLGRVFSVGDTRGQTGSLTFIDLASKVAMAAAVDIHNFFILNQLPVMLFGLVQLIRLCMLVLLDLHVQQDVQGSLDVVYNN